MDNFTTPFLKQYREIKAKYLDCLLFFRMGDFYELFMDDAFIGSRVLNITLTHKSAGKDRKVPMAGIPYHAVDSYLAKLVKAGYKVAICEQLSPPNKRGLVERDVIRVVTPGTVMDERALEKKSNNYLISLIIDDNNIALAVSDVSTGYFATTQVEVSNINEWLINELTRLSPTECILPEELYNDGNLLKLLKKLNINVYPFKDWNYYTNDADNFLRNHFKISTLSSFGLDGKTLAIQVASSLLGYLITTQKAHLTHIKKIIFYEQKNSLLLDRSTMINLELFSTIREGDTKGSLLDLLDETTTAMGGRLLKQWLKKPLIEKEEILKRHDGVEELIKENIKRKDLNETLKEVSDVERILSRLSVNIGNARDLVNLKLSIIQVLEIKKLVKEQTAEIFKNIYKLISGDIKKVIEIIEKNIIDEPPIDVRNGGMIKKRVNPDLDQLQNIIHNSKSFIETLEKQERERTGISSLKIRFNQVFGFYIEVSKSNSNLVPKHYMRKQTLVNGERFITHDLKKHEEIILSAQEKVNDLEYKLFMQTLDLVLNYTSQIQSACVGIATLDILINFANISQKYNYVRPKILYSGEIKIEKGRHPVVERLLPMDQQFVPNDVTLDNISQTLLVITGPNMAGKSVFIRQVAIILLMNQIGCFVPVKQAKLSLVDKIFVRSGAADNITSGLSTFMVEMVETANILNNATSNSLIIMDEIGRGTSTYDGISIASSVAKFLATCLKPAPKTLFATHYHELQELENEHSNIKNFHMSVSEHNDQPVFFHTLLPGGASHSFGVAVAKLAGLPEGVIKDAEKTLHELEIRTSSNVILEGVKRPITSFQDDNRLNQQTILFHVIQKELANLDIANLTPLEALNKLAEIKEKLGLLDDENKKYLEVD